MNPAAIGQMGGAMLSPDAKRALEALKAEDAPLTYEDLARAGVRRPGEAIYELQLTGHPIDQAHGRLRLAATFPDGFPMRQSRRRWSPFRRRAAA
jgi:hypothetical protein